ncbi:hypothetical protein CH373_06195 [Leptospira perolatii]|uniref:Uncharacterized protein n=1 Tax=Leptospira perolatii TaxID=2023191 RepID=A0A2M9ZNU7_9LEPT|nr:hypothetical protein [Leptospira perolatii]PJZ70856.1 hypothetical protein CH360_04925 [Leptospira perolatii]PJZ73752.1 hypothetical protein CH373_06195 [Leptospira perolatii]
MNSKLKDPYFSLVLFSIYSGIMGAALLFLPKVLLPLFNVHETVNSWTYMLGFVLICSSFYYLMSGLGKNFHFARLTVYTRFAAPVVTLILFLSGNAPVNFILLSIVDASGGLWTFLCLRKLK